MLNISAIINWNASERNTESGIKVNFRDREKIGFRFYIISIRRTELVFLSYENLKENTFQGFC